MDIAAPDTTVPDTAGADASALRPVRLHALTPAEQIAKHLGQGILQGRYGPGDRIGEQAVADLFAVSRGPVRDALRLLEKQGLVEISPRRGAFVVAFVLNDVIDSFNLRASLLALAVRYLARNPDKSALAPLAERLEELRRLTQAKDTPLTEFVKAIGRMGTGLIQCCGNRQLIQTYRNLPHDAVWQMLWVTQQPMDYDAPARRLDSLHDYEQVLLALQRGHAAKAEATMRKIMADSCREVVRHMRRPGDAVDAFRLQAL
ncbi:MAG: GntR family transcriptional regulator [Burkholderiales bacterium]|nr:GntR family transcriptional regulator [Burkholderiales bacterium]